MSQNKNNINYGWYHAASQNQHLYTEADIGWKEVSMGIPAAALGLSLLTNPMKEPKQTAPSESARIQHVDNTQPAETPTEQQQIAQPKNESAKKTNIPSFAEVRDFIANWEGKRSKAYKDSKGIWTIGIGFNLERSDADAILAKAGVTRKQVLGGTSLTDEQISKIFESNYKTAYNDALSWIPNLKDHPKDIQLLIIDFSFNMGANKLGKFPKAKAALIRKDYSTAAKELETSKWYNDVGRRGEHHVTVLRRHAKNRDHK